MILFVVNRTRWQRRRSSRDKKAHVSEKFKSKQNIFSMGKGRKGGGRAYHNGAAFRGQSELAIIERAERDIQRRSAQRGVESLQQQITKGGSTGREKTLIISGNDDTKIVYTKVDEIPSFSVRELFQLIEVKGIDMSSDLNPGVNLETMALRMSENLDEKPATFRMYMRDSINYANFAMLQHLIETMYLPRQLEELQGWIMQIGSVFVMGGVSFGLGDSVKRCKEAMMHISMSMCDSSC